MGDSSLLVARLRRRLERLEPRRDNAPAGLFAFGHAAVDDALGGGLNRGQLHEVCAGEEAATSGTGVAAMLCLRAGEKRPFLWLRTDASRRRAGRLYTAGLGELGVDPARLLLAQVADEKALLHAAVEATRCAGLGALLVECWGSMRSLDLTVSRRLMLAAEESGVTVLMLRIASEPMPSAADTRWRVAAAPSVALEANAPGAPMFELELLRRRAGPPAGPWRVEWDRDRSCFREPAQGAGSGPPLSRPVLPLVAGGEALPGAIRRTG